MFSASDRRCQDSADLEIVLVGWVDVRISEDGLHLKFVWLLAKVECGSRVGDCCAQEEDRSYGETRFVVPPIVVIYNCRLANQEVWSALSGYLTCVLAEVMRLRRHELPRQPQRAERLCHHVAVPSQRWSRADTTAKGSARTRAQ